MKTIHGRADAFIRELLEQGESAPTVTTDQARRAMVEPTAPAEPSLTPAPRGKPLSMAAAREVTRHLLRSKLQANPELGNFTDRKVMLMVAGGIKRAFIARGYAVDAEAAEGIAAAMQELIPGFRDIIQQLR